jgi:hypothetical protein
LITDDILQFEGEIVTRVAEIEESEVFEESFEEVQEDLTTIIQLNLHITDLSLQVESSE